VSPIQFAHNTRDPAHSHFGTARTLNDRVDYAFSLQTTLMELLNTKTSHRLEWIIIIVGLSSVTVVRAPGNCDRSNAD
jgi:hypothetical protein